MAQRFNWDDLRHFLAVAGEGTVSQAARKLLIDHATVIRRLDGLEQALGVKLFERNPRGYVLTRSGERLLSSARTIETEARNMERQFAVGDQRISGLVRINTLEGFGNFYLASRLPQAAMQHPNLTIELITLQQIVALSRREAEIGITLQPPKSGNLVREILTDYDLFIYGSNNYIESAESIKTRNDLKRHRFVGYIDELIFMRGLDHLDEVLPGLHANLQSSSLHAQIEATSAGHGLCVLPAFIADRRPELRRVMPREIAIRRSYWLVAGSDAMKNPRVQAVRRFIKEAVATDRSLFTDGGDIVSDRNGRMVR